MPGLDLGLGWGLGDREMTVLWVLPPARLVGRGAARTPVRLVPWPAGPPGPLCVMSPEPGELGSRWGRGLGAARCRRAGWWWCLSG